MTTIEKKKMEELLEAAIHHARVAKRAYAEYEQYAKHGNFIEAEVAQRKADSNLGFAEGLSHALAVLLYRGDGMTELQKLLD